jgi:hypothetical protein
MCEICMGLYLFQGIISTMIMVLGARLVDCPACGAPPVESVAHFMFNFPVTAKVRAHVYDIHRSFY